jgi:DNA-binding NtrC family response regulator
MATILCIDDEESILRLFQVTLEEAGYRVLIRKVDNTACVSWSIRMWI